MKRATTRTDVTEALIEGIRAQQRKGVAKYPETLHTWNRRSPSKDRLEEMVDAFQYALQEALERAELLELVREAKELLVAHRERDVEHQREVEWLERVDFILERTR